MNNNKYQWGIGIEHEMHLFHIPKLNKQNIKDIIVFDSESAIRRIIRNYEKKKIILSKSDYLFLKTIPFELSGRVCNGIKIVDKIPIKMPELITAYPFCSLNRQRTKRAIEDINEFKKKLIKLLKKDDITKKLIREYGDLNEYPYGMSRYIKYGKIKDDKYDFKKNKSKNEDKLYTDYTGSYHITLTIPYTDKTTDKEFIEMHKNFCNQLQWIEPLLLIGFFSGDEYAPGSKNNRVRGSFRIMNLGWGNMGASDIRLFDEGIGRYAKTELFWREKFKLYETDKLKPCIKPSAYARKEGGITSYGTDFRTFGDNKKGERVSGFGMKKPNGIEIRIFDNFDSIKLYNLLYLLFLLIENSMNTKTIGYVYENKHWIKQIQETMKFGYTSNISKKYIELINEKLNLNIKLEENINAYNCLFKTLYKKNNRGKYFKMLFQVNKNIIDLNNFGYKYFFMNINQKSWELAFLIKLNRNSKLLTKFNQLLKIMEYLNKINYEKIQDLIIITLGKYWENDIDNILIFLKENHFISYKNLKFKKNLIKVEKYRKMELFEENINIFIIDVLETRSIRNETIKLINNNFNSLKNNIENK